MKTYEFDIAISLCNQDIEFAKKLVANINPSLNVFFYENNQEEIIAKSGPEVFAKVFKEKSRVVVILSRDQWGESYYTGIEKNAILSRTPNEGYKFLLVIPIEQGQVPIWYPSTHIYVDPYKFTIEQIAKFIEFKVAEEGGVVKPITLEDRYEQLNIKIEEKKKLILLQETPEALASGKQERQLIKDIFNQKIEFLSQNHIFKNMSQRLFIQNSYGSYFQINDFILDCVLDNMEFQNEKLVTTQDYRVSLNISKQYVGGEKKELKADFFHFYYSPRIKGWSVPFLHEHKTENEIPVLFRDRTNRKHYDLQNPITSSTLVDLWFQELLKYSSSGIERYL